MLTRWTAFRPVTISGVVSGFFPCPCPDRCWDNPKWYWRWPALANAGLLILYVVTFVCNKPMQITMVLVTYGATERVIYFVLYLALFGGSTGIFGFMQVKSRKICGLVRKVAEVSQCPKEWRLDRLGVILVSIAVTLTLLQVGSSVSDLFLYGVDCDMYCVLFIIANGHCSMFVYMFASQVAFLSCVVCRVLDAVNKDVSDMCDKCNTDNGSRSIVDKFRELSDRVRVGYDLVECMSDVYGTHLVIMYLTFLLWTTSMIFYVIVTGFSPESIVSVVTVAVQVLCIGVSMSSFTVVLGRIPRVATSSLKDLIRVSPMITNEDFQSQIQALILQMTRSSPVEVTAGNFFSINRGLLTSIAGAVTTYLIVLAQFKGAEQGKTASS